MRVSTEEQAKEGYSISAQTDVLTAYCKLYSMNIYKVYSDLGMSGKSIEERAGLNELLDDAEKGCFVYVIVWKISRLSRSLKDLLLLVDRFENKGISFISYSEKFDTSTPVGRMTLQILGSIAEFERNTIVENVKLGLRQRAKEGKWTGNHVFGYDNVDKEIVINENEAELVKRIYEMYVEENLGFRKIADTLNTQGYRTKRNGMFGHDYIRRILTNPVYIGRVRHQMKDGKEYYEVKGIHEPIISKELFERVKDKINKHTRTRLKVRNIHALAGLLRCCNCGSNMIGSFSNANGRVYRYYKCSKYHRQGGTACTSYMINADRIEEEVLKRVGEIVKKTVIIDMVAEEICNVTYDRGEMNVKELEKIDNELGRLTILKNKYFKLFENDKVDPVMFADRLDEIREQMEDLKKRKIEVKNQRDKTHLDITSTEIEGYIRSFDKVLEYVSSEEKKELLHYMIKSIELDEEKKIRNIDLRFPI
ncbi:recombinase family protein [Pseudobacteroides cellulosolvens]|uniref:Resolvase domain-containing protein n=1 Tax=Pseudobacteroides cellulosolvens ATCC 35603 = DSM 2933 TaxID=398512 RepID=A0A0L6JH97_9FIRM|nr:recombinase family protein [Pseudobacteroides cellulosolvens]KNY25201.1 Resolvase domain-containing protein [Pseudobacteroides cellulosolvens ATCC 35603 = DSM 2933]